MRVDYVAPIPPELLQVDARDAATETVITLDGEFDISAVSAPPSVTAVETSAIARI